MGADHVGTEEPRIIRQFKENLEFTGGTAVKYDQSTLFAPATHQALATGEEIGRRFHSAPVVRLADARQMHLGHAAEADGRWRLYAFAGSSDGSAPGSAIHKLADWLQSDPQSPRWFSVDVKLDRRIDPPITLKELREHQRGALKDLLLLRRGNRLSVTPVTAKEWNFILGMR